MSFKGFSIFSFSGHFIQPSGTIVVILVEGYKRNISVKFILKLGYWPWGGVGEGEMSFKVRFYFPAGKEVSCLFFSSGSHFIQQSGTILANLVKGHKRNVSVKSF